MSEMLNFNDEMTDLRTKHVPVCVAEKLLLGRLVAGGAAQAIQTTAW